MGLKICVLCTYCMQKNAIWSHYIHTTLEGYFRAAMYEIWKSLSLLLLTASAATYLQHSVNQVQVLFPSPVVYWSPLVSA